MIGAEAWTVMAILGPLLAALIALEGRPAFVRTGLFLGVSASGAAAAGLWREVALHGPALHRLGGWGRPLGIELHVDGLGVVMLTVTAAVGAAVSLYATEYFGDLATRSVRDSPAGRGARFFAPLALMLWAALNGIYLSADLFNLYVNLEILGLSAAAMVTLAVTRQATVAGMRYLVVSLVGSMLFLLGVALLYVEYGTLSLAELEALRPDGPAAMTALAVMTVGLAAKTALFPFHAWLPPAHAAAPAPASALLSSLVVKGSFVIVVRVWFHVYAGGTPPALVAMGLMGGAGMVWGSVMALRQTSFKRLIAYSTIAQLGLLFIMFPLMHASAGGASVDAWTGGIVLVVSHALAKAAMFLAAGNMTYAVASDAIRSISGTAHRLPMSFLAFAVGGLSLAGLPPSAGFAGKWLLLRSALEPGRWGWAVLIALGGLLTLAYVLRVLPYALRVEEAPEHFRAVPRRMELAAMALALAAVLLGLRATSMVEMLGGVWSG